MSLATFARISSSLSVVGILVAMIISAASVSTPSATPSDNAGTYRAAGLAPTDLVTHGRVSIGGTRTSDVREVDINGFPLLEGVDYTVAEEGSSESIVQFITRPLAGDHVEVFGATLDAGVHSGSISFH